MDHLPCKTKKKLHKSAQRYLIAVILGIACALSHIEIFHDLGKMVADVFMKIFKCVSLPIITLSIITTLGDLGHDKTMEKMAKRTLFYTITTTISAAAIACLMYVLIAPKNIHGPLRPLVVESFSSRTGAKGYMDYVLELVPDNMLSPFVHHHVMGALFISIVLGMAIRYIPDQSTRRHTFSFFKGIHGIFLIITSWVVKIIPIALFGFICTTIVDCQKGINFSSLSGYFGVVILSNLVQGFLVLPIFLKCHSIRPFHALKAMMPALSVAFFSKSSAGALPVTIQTIENRLHVSSRVSRFVLPLCTSINMNGCAAFIFATVIYLMQNHGVDINFTTMILWIFIATIAAIGNAGIPMGCFFLSASLLTTMDIPINILGMILPIYSIIDMVETALNVWSDACVSLVVDKKETQLIKNNHVPIDQAS